MSTRIDHGYRVNLGPYGGSLFGFHHQLTQVLTDTFTDVYLKTSVPLATVALDRLRYDGQPVRFGTDDDLDDQLTGLGSCLMWADDLMARKQRRITDTGRRDPRFDVGVTVAYLGDPADANVAYLLLYAEQGAYAQTLQAMPGVAWYGFYNHVDRPADVTADDWEARAATWDRLVGADAPAARGLTWDLAPGSSTATAALFGVFTDPDALTGYIPDEDTRARALAEQLPMPKPADDIVLTDARGRLNITELRKAFEAHIAAVLPAVRASLRPVTGAALRLRELDTHS